MAYWLVTMVIIPNNQYKAAVSLMDAGQYEKAIVAFKAMEGYKNSNEQIEACQIAIKDQKYNAAIELMKNEEYEEAIYAFSSLGKYKDSKEQIIICQTTIKDMKYADAVSLMDNQQYEEAITAFTALAEYKDSKDQANSCRYEYAVVLLNEGKIIDAYEEFITLDGYKDSAAKATELYAQYKDEKMKAPEVGDTIFFGAYEQDNNTTNGKEDIKWLVLAKQNNKILVISDKILDARHYNREVDITWEECSLRKWLNVTFLNYAFNAEEQDQILNARISADKNPQFSTNPGNATTDKVFLLSITEAEKYFTSNSARLCKPTEYALAERAEIYSKTTGGCSWWLRSPGSEQERAANVAWDGRIDYFGMWATTVNGSYGIRPAMWIEIPEE